MGISLWQQPAPAESVIKEKLVILFTEEEAEKTAIDTRAMINSRGYCLWTCQVLRGETILLVDADKCKDIPEPLTAYATYNLRELDLLRDLPEGTLRLIHLAKKLGGASVESVIKKAGREAE